MYYIYLCLIDERRTPSPVRPPRRADRDRTPTPIHGPGPSLVVAADVHALAIEDDGVDDQIVIIPEFQHQNDADDDAASISPPATLHSTNTTYHSVGMYKFKANWYLHIFTNDYVYNIKTQFIYDKQISIILFHMQWIIIHSIIEDSTIYDKQHINYIISDDGASSDVSEHDSVVVETDSDGRGGSEAAESGVVASGSARASTPIGDGRRASLDFGGLTGIEGD